MADKTTQSIEESAQNLNSPTESAHIAPLDSKAPYGYKADGTPKKKRGRPKKAELAKAKNPVGRPRGDNSAIAEMKARLLASPKSKKVLDTILDAALDDEHKNQSAAWKLLVDRMLPVSYFEKDKDSNGRAAVNITISGVGGEAIDIGSSQATQPSQDIEDIDYEVKDV